MANNYKIYYNESYLLISNDRGQMNENFTKSIIGEEDVSNFLRNPIFYSETATKTENIFLYTERPDWVMNFIRKNSKVVIAAGGLVFNEKDELLIIHRKGKWDIAKGKIDEGEQIIKAAEREVEEETGVKIERIIDDPYITYHAYILKGKNCLKETSWYEMKAVPGQTKLVPQAEEGITDVRWVKKSDLQKYEAEAHPLVRDLIKAHYPM